MNPQQFSEWKRLPETQEFFRWLWQCRLYAMEEWARRRLMNESAEVTRDANSMQLGAIKVFDEMLEVTQEDIEHFNELWKGLKEREHPARFEDAVERGEGMGAAGQAGPG